MSEFVAFQYPESSKNEDRPEIIRCSISSHAVRVVALLFAVISTSCMSTFHPKAVVVPLPDRKTFETSEQTVLTPGGSYPMTVSLKGRPPLLLLHELNGQVPGTLSLAKELADLGYKVYVPRFFGDYGKEMNPAQSLMVSLSTHWAIFSEEGGPITRDIHAIAASIAAKHPNQPLTVIGNCMSGGQALGLLAEPYVQTAVVCQPATPMSPLGLVGIASRPSPSRIDSFGIPSAYQASAIAALKAHPEKRLISFNYRDDSIALLPRTIGLAKKTFEAGVAKQHQLYIGIPEGSPSDTEATHCLVRHPGWHPLVIWDTKKHHSTVTGANCCDRVVFREALFSALRLPPRKTTR